MAKLLVICQALFCCKDGQTFGRVIEKQPWPLNDEVVIYVRNVGLNDVVGQAWQEGQDLKQLPKKLCSEILMVKDYAPFDTTW